MSARKIPKNYRNITGQISSSKSDKPISFESKLERDFYLLFEFENDIVSIKDQPIKIEYIEENEFGVKVKSYTPDVFIERKGLPNILGEVKYYETLKTEWGVLKPKFKAAMDYVRQQDEPTIFVLFTDRCEKISNKNYIRNVHFLNDYNKYSSSDYETIKSIYQEDITIQELLQIYSTDKIEQMRLVPALWSLVKDQVVEIDLTQPLNMKSRIFNVKDAYAIDD